MNIWNMSKTRPAVPNSVRLCSPTASILRNVSVVIYVSSIAPADAIIGDVRKPHVIDPNKCIKCGMCMARCKFKAINVC